MTLLADLAEPPEDICLLLQAYAEQRWLARELLPHLRELERMRAISDAELGTVTEEQLRTKVSYLEAVWFDAGGRAAQTDAAFAKLDRDAGMQDGEHGEQRRRLRECADHYYEALRVMRRELGSRVSSMTHTGEAHGRRRGAGSSPRLRAGESTIRSAGALDTLGRHAGARRGGGTRR
jgi:hypothetical protein